MTIHHRPPLVIDTCALSNADFRNWLMDYNAEKKIPAVVYMEFCLYMLEKKKKDLAYVDRMLRMMGIAVEPFRMTEAKIATELMAGRVNIKRCVSCNKLNWNDCMVASHAPIAPTIVVTDNIGDFPDLGGRVKTPRSVMAEIRQ